MPSTTQTGQFDLPLRYPTGSSPVSVPTDLRNLAQDVAAALAALPRFAKGTVSITPSAANVATMVHVDFPDGLFDGAPDVYLALSTGTNVSLQVESQGVDVDGADIYIVAGNTTARNVNWLAIQF